MTSVLEGEEGLQEYNFSKFPVKNEEKKDEIEVSKRSTTFTIVGQSTDKIYMR